MTSRPLAVIVLPWLLTAAFAAQQKTKNDDRPAPVAIFVTSAGAANGLTDPSKENRDSVKDVSDELKKKPQIVKVVDSQAEAAITVTILGRERSDVVTDLGVIGRHREVYVKARLSYQGTNADLKGMALASVRYADPSTGMKAAGREVAKQVLEWVTQNRAAINPPAPTSGR